MKSIIKIIIVTMLVITGNNLFASSPNQHVGVSLHEDMITNFFTSIGEISGKGSKKVLGKKVKYKWTVKEPNVDIEPGSATFQAKVVIKAGKIKTSKAADSIVDVTYIKESNRIRIEVREMKVKLSFNFMVQKVRIGTIDLAKYYKPSFEFTGPQPIQSQVEIVQPDESIKLIDIVSTNENLVLEKDKVTVYSDLEFNPVQE